MKANLTAIPVVKGSKVSKDGNTTYYTIGLVQDGELIEFSTVESVHKSADLYKPNNFELTITKGEYQGKVFERKMITAIIR